MTREELEKAMGNEPKIQASFEAIGDDGKFIKLIVNGKEKVVSIEELEKTLPEPCEDCISRAELLKAVDTWDKFGCDADSKLVPYKDCYVPYIHYDDVVKAIKGMPSIQPKTGWIPVSERLPDKTGLYLISTGDLVSTYPFDGHNFRLRDNTCIIYADAWMELPKPYNGSEE